MPTTISGSDFDDNLDGSYDVDYIYGFDGDDLIRGSDGDDDIYGGYDHDTIYGGFGADYLIGGAETATNQTRFKLSEIELCRCLPGVRVLGALVDLEVAHEHALQRPPLQHPLDG